jgi:hypothetical protein
MFSDCKDCKKRLTKKYGDIRCDKFLVELSLKSYDLLRTSTSESSLGSCLHHVLDVSSEVSILKINLKKNETKECTQHLMESLIWQNKTFKRSQKVPIISDEFGDGPYFIHKRKDNNVDILVLVMLSPKCMNICEIINFSPPDNNCDQIFKSHVFVFPESK